MTDFLVKVSFPFLVLETLVGTMANGSIILINFMDWFRRRKLFPTDLILTCLALSRILLQAIMILDAITFILYNNTLNKIQSIVPSLVVFTNTVNLWFTAWLSVFYLTKIAIFSHPVFLQVKRRLSGFLPWLLLSSVVFSAVVAVIFATSWTWNCGSCTCNGNRSLSSNRSNADRNMAPFCSDTLALIVIFDLLPFMVFLTSSIFLISSLWKHVRRVQHNGSGTRDLNTQAHWSAIKALASFALLYLISFSALTSQVILVWNNEYTWATAVFNVSALCPSGHAVILIIINPKLKQAWIRMLKHFKGGLRCKVSGNFKPMPKKSGGMKILGKFSAKFDGNH